MRRHISYAPSALSVVPLFESPSFLTSPVILGFIGWLLVRIPIKNAGRADEPAPPSAVF